MPEEEGEEEEEEEEEVEEGWGEGEEEGEKKKKKNEKKEEEKEKRRRMRRRRRKEEEEEEKEEEEEEEAKRLLVSEEGPCCPEWIIEWFFNIHWLNKILDGILSCNTKKIPGNLFTINFYLSMTVPNVHGVLCAFYFRVKAIHMRSGIYVQLMLL